MKQSYKAEVSDVERELHRGSFREQYLVYCRKSTDEPNNQKNSLSYQKEQIAQFAHREKIRIANINIPGFCRDGVISEKHSAFKNESSMIVNDDHTVQFGIERPKFHRLAQYLSQGLIKGVVCLCWDRASRNSADSSILKKLRKRGVDFRFVLATYDKSSSGELHMDIDDMFAEHHSRVTSEKVKLANLKNKRNGFCTHKAPVGYLNTGSVEHKPLDPVRAPLVTRMFELADDGWSLVDIARWVTEQGFTMSPKRKRRTHAEMLADEEQDNPSTISAICLPPRYTTIQQILRNRFYTGMVRGENGVWAASRSHTALVSMALFERVQEKLHLRNRSKRYKTPLAHPFRGMVTCAGCRRVYTPYIKKGILYLTSRCRDECENTKRNINLHFLSLHVPAAITKLSLTQEELDQLDTCAEKAIATKHGQEEQREAAIRRQKTIREEIAYLKENKLVLLKSLVYSPEELVLEEQRLQRSLNQLEHPDDESLAPPDEAARLARNISELIKNTAAYWEFANPFEKESICRIVFSELRISQKTLECKAIPALTPFEDSSFSICARTTWLSELSKHARAINSAIDLLASVVPNNTRVPYEKSRPR